MADGSSSGHVPSAYPYQDAAETVVEAFVFLPASGNRNEDNLNNHGSNGNYWSSSLNPNNNDNNAYNLNFNSGNCNVNNNNRNNGHTVRAVCQ